MAQIAGRISEIVAGFRQPREGMLVSIVLSDQPFNEIAAATDANGEFALYNLMPANYVVSIGGTLVDVTIRDANESVHLDAMFPERA